MTRSRTWQGLVVACLLALAPSAAHAALGDCLQPISTGATPTASDCLFILRASVGIQVCDPQCICDPNASGTVSATDALVCLKKAVGQEVTLNCPCGGTTTTSSSTTSSSSSTTSSTLIVTTTMIGTTLPTTTTSTTTTTLPSTTTTLPPTTTTLPPTTTSTTTTTIPSTTTTTVGGTTTTTMGSMTQDPQCPNKGMLVLAAGVRSSCTTNADCPVGECDTGLSRCRTATVLDTGYTGLGHDSDVNDAVVAMGNLLCTGPANPGCGECQVTGINPEPGNCRCANDNRTICDQPFAADDVNCGGATCNCYFGPPLPLSAGNVPACVVNRFASDISGTADVDLGAGNITTALRSLVYLGESLVVPCPYCTGDTTPNDGVRDGSCVLGANAGMSCDVDAVNDTFPAPGGDGHSIDCFPDTGKNVSGQGLSIVLDQTTGVSSVGSDVVCGFPGPPLNLVLACPCGVCSDDASDGTPCSTNTDCGGCTTNADCAVGGAGGVCDGSGNCECVRRANLDPVPNQCGGNAVCLDDGTGAGTGTCEQGPSDKFCDAITRANGEGFIQCNSNADCAPGAIGIDAGNCTLSKTRQCFLDTIVATGTPDPNNPIGGAVFCIPPTGNNGINTAAGLPGPGRVLTQATSTLYCASDPGTIYQPGIGGCP